MGGQEKKAPLSVGELTTLGLSAGILLAVQVALAGLPNIELVSLLVLLYTIHFGRKSLWIIYGFVLLEGVLYGFGLWWFGYLYLWALYHLAVYPLRHNTSPVFWALCNRFFGLLFGVLSSLPYFITGGLGGGVAYIVAGLPFDLAHCAGNFFTALILFVPLNRCLTLVRRVGS